MLGAVNLTKNTTDFWIYMCFRNGIEFDTYESFSLYNGSGKNMIIFWCRYEILVQTAEKEYAINFSEQQIEFCLSLLCDRVTIYLFVKRFFSW